MIHRPAAFPIPPRVISLLPSGYFVAGVPFCFYSLLHLPSLRQTPPVFHSAEAVLNTWFSFFVCPRPINFPSPPSDPKLCSFSKVHFLTFRILLIPLCAIPLLLPARSGATHDPVSLPFFAQQIVTRHALTQTLHLICKRSFFPPELPPPGLCTFYGPSLDIRRRFLFFALFLPYRFPPLPRIWPVPPRNHSFSLFFFCLNVSDRRSLFAWPSNDAGVSFLSVMTSCSASIDSLFLITCFCFRERRTSPLF